MKDFPPFRLDLVNQCLWRHPNRGDDERILLTPKAFAVLRYLVEHAGQLVTHDELLDAVWPNTHIQPQAIKKLILDLRGALVDRASKPLFIETLHRRGYRFIAALSEGTGALPAIPAQPARSSIVGRACALGELRDCLGNALKGERQIVFITGEPGIGKTSLADAFQHQAAAEVPGLRIARGQCVEGYGGKEAYYPMLEALGQLCRGPGGDSVVQTLAAQAPTWLVQFPALVKREQREMLQREILGATRERMLREIGDALETITSESPLLLVFEDLQWVDYSTVDLLSALARRRAPARLMLIGTKRPLDMISPEHPVKALKQDLLLHLLCREIKLEPLGEAEVAEYLTAASSEAKVPEGLAELVYHHSEGNPLFMMAALDHMTERGLLSRESGSWKLTVPLEEIELEVPQKLRRMIEVQIDRLKPEEQRALEAASIAGTVFSPEVCAAAVGFGSDGFEDLCQELSRRHHIVRSAGSQQFPDGTVCSRYEFVHALYREVTTLRLSPTHRARLHQHVGERLESLFFEHLSEVAAELAQHFEEASDWARAVKYSQLEAEAAGRRFAPREAAAILQHALKLSSRLQEAERATVEIKILQKLAVMYVALSDTRLFETYEALIARAVQAGRVEVEVQALIDITYPLSVISSQRCLDALERALRLCSSQKDSLMQARTRASCLVQKIWARGWNAQDAEECLNALAEIRKSDDRLLVAAHVIDCDFILWSSSRYREAKRNAIESLAILMERSEENPYLSFAYNWLNQILPWTLLLLGEWGEALAEIGHRITLADKNGNHSHGQALRLYQALVHFFAMDFAGVVRICESVLPFLQNPGRGPWRRLGLILIGSAETSLGNYESAQKHLSAAMDEMGRETLLFDWYSRMMLESALTELWLAKGDLKQARTEAGRFLEATLATAERTWQALAWEANARVAMAQLDLARAGDCIVKALSTMEGFEVPLAEWRVHATAAELYARAKDNDRAEHHRELSRATILKLADSLPAEEPLRKVFLSAPSVLRVLGDPETAYIARPKNPSKWNRRSRESRS